MDLRSVPPKIIIYESELEFIARCVMDFPHLETGGDFFGLWTKEGYPVIQFVTGPGKKIERTASHFNQDIDYLKESGSILNARYGLEHIGAWHSHHRMKLHEPSPGDVHTMRTALRGTGFSRFIISICNIDKHGEVFLNGFLFQRENINNYRLCNWTILDDISPVRTAVLHKEGSPFHEPSTEAADVSYYVKNTEAADVPVTKEIAEKPDIPKNAYWNTPEGKKYLKDVFDKLKKREDLADVELVQLPDKRIAVSFRHDNSKFEIRFPHEFPDKEAEVVEKIGVGELVRLLRSARKPKGRIGKFLESINILDKI
ncbi:MAG TPA: hypothetical protein VNJ07_13200 [Chitinophagales bacterium]|nr:hypothetical protein [Chitinophagales bacterium]